MGWAASKPASFGGFLGGICRQTHEMFAMVVENRKSDTLSKAVFENVESGSSIYSDCWKAYNKLSQMGLNFNHQTVNHSQNFVNPNNPDVNTNTVERSWRSLRENVPMQVGLDSVESYIDKFLFFHNKNHKGTKARFDAIVSLLNDFSPRN